MTRRLSTLFAGRAIELDVEAGGFRRCGPIVTPSSAIARHLVESMGGRIEVESTPGEGSTFRFSLPVAP